MGWQTTQLGSPLVKGVGKFCMGVAICGVVYFLDTATTSFTQDEAGKFVKYAAYTGGVIYALGGISKIVNGE